MQIGTVHTAKFTHDGGTGVGLRIQGVLLVRDDAGRVACVRLQDAPDAWLLPVELLRLNEDPLACAERIAKAWFATPVRDVRVASVESWPATGPEDRKWYLLVYFEARAEGELAGTPDTLEVRFAEPGKAPGPWGMSHADVWERVR